MTPVVDSAKTFADMTPEESQATCAKARHELRKEKQEPYAEIKPFSEIEAKEITWLWDKRIPLGMLTIYAGNPGLGKSFLSLDLASRLSRGLPFPDGSPCPIGDTLIFAGEDTPEFVIKPRLEALGANMAHIHFMFGKRENHVIDDFSLADSGVLRDALDQIKAMRGELKLLIIDPLESFIGNIDGYKNIEVRLALNGVLRLAAAENFSVLAIQHLTKKTGIDVNHRISGSVAYAAAARAIWLFTRDPDNPTGRLFLNSKMNVGMTMPGFHYSIETAENGAGLVTWGEPAENDPNDVLNTIPTPKQAPEQNKIFELIEGKYPVAIKTQEIVAVTGKSPSRVSNILKGLEMQGKIKRSTTLYGFWELSHSPISPIGNNRECESYSQDTRELSQGVNVKGESVKVEREEEPGKVIHFPEPEEDLELF
jgi:RecA-family ATPase